MPSRFAWIDADESSRRSMLQLIDQFRDQGTVDELGIGTIRDAFADFFFPGTSTIQTRARYFLFVPWIYRSLEDRKVPSAEMSRRLRSGELKLLEAMLDAGVGDGEGLIGRQSKATLKRWPSSIYWAGLKTWGIRRFHGSQDAYHRWLNTWYRRQQGRHEDEADELVPPNWDPDSHFPMPPEGFPEGATMDLRRDESEYLSHRIRVSCPGSLLALLLGNARALDADSIWTLPRLGDLPDRLRAVIAHAQRFAQVMEGASLLYYWYAAHLGMQEERAANAEDMLQEWADELNADWRSIAEWIGHLSAFWLVPALNEVRVPERTRAFVTQWARLLLESRGTKLWKHGESLLLIKERERQTKGEARAKLWNARLLERWDPVAAPGRLDYRWRGTRILLRDIHDGLQAEEG